MLSNTMPRGLDRPDATSWNDQSSATIGVAADVPGTICAVKKRATSIFGLPNFMVDSAMVQALCSLKSRRRKDAKEKSEQGTQVALQ